MTAEVVYANKVAAPAGTDWPAVLRYLGLSPDAAESRALVLVADRYGLDPLLGHVALIATGGAHRPYITRDGMLDIAHRSGQLDGIVVDEQRRNSTGDGWTAYVSVWRKDMSHPFRYGAQCKDTERQAKAGYGPEQALARAERRALVRAFNIADGADDPRELDSDGLAEGGPDPTPEHQSARLLASGPPAPDTSDPETRAD